MKMYSGTIRREALGIRSGGPYYAKQKQYFVLVVIVVALLPLIVLSLTSAHTYRQSWFRQTETQLQSLARSRQEMIDLFLRAQEDRLDGFVELLDLPRMGKGELQARMAAVVNRSRFITDLGVIDRNGDHLAYVGPYQKQLANRNYAASDWFRQTMAGGRYVSDVFTGFRGVPHLVVAVAGPGREWVMRATINSEGFNSLLDSAAVGPGGDAFICNLAGRLQTTSRRGLTSIDGGEVALLAARQGREVVQRDGFLVAAVPVKGGEWLLVLKTDIDSSLAPFYRARNLDVVIIAGAGLLILTVASLLVRSMVNRVETADRQRMMMNDRVRQVEKMALVGRLAASVAHEINNPLQIIGDQAGWIGDLMEEEGDMDPARRAEYQQTAASIKKQVKRASAITHRLLGFSRPRENERAAVNINSLAEETVSFLEKEAANHGISINLDLQGELPPVVSDAGQLQQVFLNILNNAIDASGQDGSITVRTTGDRELVRVEFADSGPGMSESALKRIFDPFFTTKGGKGTGLGLSISFNIMQRLGGEILARNGRNGGCVFTVKLPVSAAAAEAA